MGYAIAGALSAAGHTVDLVTGPVEIPPPPQVRVHAVTSALEMQTLVESLYPRVDWVFGVAAVADYRPQQRLPGKPKKQAHGFALDLVPNPDILGGLGRNKGRHLLVGWALESPAEGGVPGALARGRAKLAHKHLDLVVVNLTPAMGAEDNEVWLVRADGSERALARADKDTIAREIVAEATRLAADPQHSRGRTL